MAIVKERLSDNYSHSKFLPGWNILAGLGCLIFFAPLIAAVYLAMRAQAAPVFVRHSHTRKDGTSFQAWKFRSTRRETGLRTDDWRSSPSDQGLTKIGLWLFRTRLEILPYFYNVARGDISLAEMFQDI